MSVKEFFHELEQNIRIYFPSAGLEINEFNVLRLKVRIMITSCIFIDVFYGHRKKRIDFALIKDEGRVFGIDNLSGWHYHPIECPNQHEKTSDLSQRLWDIGTFFRILRRQSSMLYEEGFTMVSMELMDELYKLSRADKLHVIQFLVSELTQEEVDLLQAGRAYPVWSPYNAFEAAGKMLEVLKAAEIKDLA